MKLKLHFLLIFFFTTSILFAQFPVTNGLVANYEFNNNLNDGVANNDMASSSGASSFAADRLNNQNSSLFVDRTQHQGYVFSGVNNAVSISFWASFSPTSASTERLLHLYDLVHGGGFRIEYNRPNGEVNFIAQTANTGAVSRTTSLPTTSSNVWHHFVVTIRIVNSIAEGRVYIDGTLATDLSMDFIAGGDFYNNTSPLQVSPINGPTNPAAYSGKIDDIYVYNRVIHSTEVSAIYNYSSPPDIIYVDINATGANDGTSWAHAYTDLWSALDNINNGDEIWMASGTYSPSFYPSKTYGVNNDNLKIYGGFSGTETNLEDRDISLIHTTNETILSGDINNNDDTNVSFGNATRTDNSNAVIKILKTGVTLDGLTISDGYADALSGNDRFGAGIFLDPEANVFTIENCIVKDNVAYWAAGMYINPTFNSNIKINACVFENNLGVLTGAFYIIPNSSKTMNLRITNCLFNGNRTEDDSVTDPNTIRRGLGAPAGWIRAFNSNTFTNTTLVNNTFVNNVALGTGVNTDFPVLGLSKSSSNGANSTNVISNNIFWGNTRNNGQLSLALGRVVDVFNFTESQISNNIDEDGFTNLGVGVGSINNSGTNPNLTTDFKLQATSTAAIDMGTNNGIPTGITLDLAGNNRIENTTVDIGAYEYATTLSNNDFNLLSFKIYPNPASSILNIKTDKEIELITIHSILGNKVMIKKDTKTIDIRQLNSGVYLLKVYYSNQAKSTSLKFIKN
tara:strand:- start:50055 stop:52271 length:2217 start_codon:yes stop_codon:yes gene_type:complete